MKITVIGGDRRQLYAAKALQKAGAEVALVGFETHPDIKKLGIKTQTLADLGDDTACVLLPFPAESADGMLNAPFASAPIAWDTLFAVIPSSALVLGGKLSARVAELAALCGIKPIDYAEREELQIKNAVPSAEGAIQLAMEHLPKTLHGSRCLVIGYGRIGKVLAEMLTGLGAVVTVSARKPADLAWIAARGFDAEKTAELEGKLGQFAVVFNTVPAMVLPIARLTELAEDCLVIDLASKPGGVDFAAAATLGVQTLHALALPGKVAPESAGIAVAETVMAILSERGL